MMSNDLWPEIVFNEDKEIEENRTLDILRQQAKAIKQKTKGVIRSSVSQIYYSEGIVEVIEHIRDAISQNRVFTNEELELEKELENKQDINEVLKKTSYRFEIYTDYYRFRILQLLYSEDFPVEIILDEGIRNECNFERIITINNNAQLESVLKEAFNCNKMRRIINKMISSDIEKRKEEQLERQILDLIKNNPSITIKEIANQMNWSASEVNNHINRMINKGVLVKKDVNGNNLLEVIQN